MNKRFLLVFALQILNSQICSTSIKRDQSYNKCKIYAFVFMHETADFIQCLSSCGLEHLAEKILEYLDDQSLKSCELVSHDWFNIIAQGRLKRKNK